MKKYTSKDFSVEGRESFLGQVYFDTHGKFEKWELNFARWTLLERIIWEFKPDDTHCHLDGFDFDIVHNYRNGFIGIGRVWLLENTKVSGDIYATMAIEFDEDIQAVKKGRFWVSAMPVIKGNVPPYFDIPPLKSLFTKTNRLGQDWQIALSRNSSGWVLNNSFDLSVFLKMNDDEG